MKGKLCDIQLETEILNLIFLQVLLSSLAIVQLIISCHCDTFSLQTEDQIH